ncbi:MAG: hypothetical protein N2Z70_05980 [Bdellovibrionaceae bacterium]|nr:hypothetical protein [Pseudobdellovibrionaceae bacterium]
MRWMWLRIGLLLLALWGTFRLMSYLQTEEAKQSPLFWLLAPPQMPPSPTPEQLPPRVREALEHSSQQATDVKKPSADQ